MWMTGIVAGVAAGWLTGGSVRHFASKELNSLWAALLSAVLQLAISGFGRQGLLAQFSPHVHFVSYLPLLWFLWQNRMFFGMQLLAAGTLLNFAAIGANGGRMPVDTAVLASIGESRALQILQAGTSPTHQMLTERTRLAFLGDCFVFPDVCIIPHTVFSLGDAVMVIGLAVLVRTLMQPAPDNGLTG
jgi:hypothetical protein